MGLNRYPERLSLAVPKGWIARVDRLAAGNDMGRPEWMRALLRRAFEADRKARERKAAAK